MSILSDIPTFFVQEDENQLYANITEIHFGLNFVSVPDYEYNVEWSFGDGTTSEELFPVKTYSYANDFEVRCVVYKKNDGGNDDYAEYKRKFRIRNYIDDTISWDTFFSFSSIQQCKKTSEPFKINFTCSEDSLPVIRLFAQNSKSRPYEQPQNKYSHLKPQWKFTNPYTVSSRNPHGDVVDYLPINEQNVERLYDSNGNFLGLTGFGEFYYIDDLPSNDLYSHSEYPNSYVTINAILEFSSQDSSYNTYTTDSNSFLTKNVTVLPSVPNGLMISHNGMKTNKISGLKWVGKRYKLNIAIVDDEENILKQYPINNSNPINLSVTSYNDTLEITNKDSLVINRTDSNGFSIGGYVETEFYPKEVYYESKILIDCQVKDYSNPSIVYDFEVSTEEFKTLEYYDNYRIVKNNEDFDMHETLKSYALQYTIKENPKLWDVVVKNVVGDIDSDENDIGKMIYEKISNYVLNNSDIDTCNVEQFYSMFEEVGQKTPKFLQNFPSKIKRLLNLFSVNLNRLEGDREKFGKDFGLYLSNVNMGEQITTNPFTINAGEKFVFRTKYSDFYELIEAVELNGSSSYDIDVLAENYGFKLPIFEYYEVYRYLETYTNTRNEGIIDWENSNLSEGNSYEDWIARGNIIESVYDFYLRDSLGIYDEDFVYVPPTFITGNIVDANGNDFVDSGSNNIIFSFDE
jgi:hypothetical protein